MTEAKITGTGTTMSLAALMKKIGKYKTLETAPSMVDRYAHFIDYCSREVPYAIIPYALAVRMTTGITRPDTKAVDHFRGAITRTRVKLLAVYNRDLLVPAKSGGVRGTVTEDDRVVTYNDKLKDRVVTATGRAMEHSNTINPNKISNPAIKRRFLDGNRELGLMSSITQRMAKLAAPKGGNSGG